MSHPPTTKNALLVTGAGGFIGRAVVNTLVSNGSRVRVLLGPDDTVPGWSIPSNETFLGDICDSAVLQQAMGGINTVVHLAGPASVSQSFESPTDFARIHVMGTVHALEQARLNGVQRFVYVSSAEVYGQPQSNPVVEDHVLAPRSPYGTAKLGAERFAQMYAEAHGLQCVVLRLFSVFGPGATKQSLLAAIGRQLDNAAIELFDLRPIRDYCFVEDVAKAIAAACAFNEQRYSVFNIASGIGTSVKQLAELVVELAGRDIPVRQRVDSDRPRKVQIDRLIADCSRARDLLGWTPSYSLKDGLARTFGFGMEKQAERNLSQHKPSATQESILQGETI